MYKLKYIISSGGTNPKINKAINRYELSKDKKKDIINSIKTNVPQSGGSGEGSNMEYLDVSGVDFVNGGTKEGNFLMCSFMVKCNHTILGNNAIVPIGQLYNAGTSNTTSIYALVFDFSAKYIISSGIEQINFTLKELLIQIGWTEEELAAIPRLTKEQFYNLEA